jgi:glycosyltransferase involved in cell wall biosynthesis
MRELGQRARERARTVFDWEKITDQYEAVYRGILDAD